MEFEPLPTCALCGNALNIMRGTRGPEGWRCRDCFHAEVLVAALKDVQHAIEALDDHVRRKWGE